MTYKICSNYVRFNFQPFWQSQLQDKIGMQTRRCNSGMVHAAEEGNSEGTISKTAMHNVNAQVYIKYVLFELMHYFKPTPSDQPQ